MRIFPQVWDHRHLSHLWCYECKYICLWRRMQSSQRGGVTVFHPGDLVGWGLPCREAPNSELNSLHWTQPFPLCPMVLPCLMSPLKNCPRKSPGLSGYSQTRLAGMEVILVMWRDVWKTLLRWQTSTQPFLTWVVTLKTRITQVSWNFKDKDLHWVYIVAGKESLVSSIHIWQFTNLCNSSFRVSDALLWPPQALHSRGAHAWRKTLIHVR